MHSNTSHILTNYFFDVKTLKLSSTLYDASRNMLIFLLCFRRYLSRNNLLKFNKM